MTDQLLRDAFVAHEHLAPDADLALEGIQQGIRTRRRSRLAVTGAVVAVVVAVAGASMVAGGTNHNRPEQAPAPATKVPPARTTQTHRPAVRPVVAQLTIGAGWLPAGTVHRDAVSVGFGVEAVSYTVTPRTGAPLLVGLTTSAGTDFAIDDSKRGAGHDLKINGLPAREWVGSDGSSHLAVLLPAGREATVDVDAADSNNPPSATTVTQVGRRVAQSMQFNRPSTAATQLAVSYIPAGLTVRRIDGDELNSTIITLAPPNAQQVAAPGHQSPPTFTTIALMPDDMSPPPTAPGTEPAAYRITTAGRPVNEHKTFVSRQTKVRPDIDEDGTILYVLNVRPGKHLVITGGVTVTDVNELYRIATGVTALP